MNINELKEKWLNEEKIAKINGWDFSYIKDRHLEKPLSFSYYDTIKKYLKDDYKLLDIDTGGGEFLMTLNHPPKNISCTEGYDPNILLCIKKLLPLGINFKEAKDYSNLPFCDNSFDIIINRHGSYNVNEIKRLLKPNGLFITQQVGEDNDLDLINLLLPNQEKSFPNHNEKYQSKLFIDAGFEKILGLEEFGQIDFYDVGAIVWFSKIIEWEFIDFSVEKCFNQLLKCEKIISKTGKVSTRTHRFLLVMQCKKN